MIDTDIETALNYFIDDAGNQKKAAKKLGISCAYLNDILKGRRKISENVAKKLGFKKIVYYAKILGDK